MWSKSAWRCCQYREHVYACVCVGVCGCCFVCCGFCGPHVFVSLADAPRKIHTHTHIKYTTPTLPQLTRVPTFLDLLPLVGAQQYFWRPQGLHPWGAWPWLGPARMSQPTAVCVCVCVFVVCRVCVQEALEHVRVQRVCLGWLLYVRLSENEWVSEWVSVFMWEIGKLVRVCVCVNERARVACGCVRKPLANVQVQQVCRGRLHCTACTCVCVSVRVCVCVCLRGRARVQERACGGKTAKEKEIDFVYVCVCTRVRWIC